MYALYKSSNILIRNFRNIWRITIIPENRVFNLIKKRDTLSENYNAFNEKNQLLKRKDQLIVNIFKRNTDLTPELKKTSDVKLSKYKIYLVKKQKLFQFTGDNRNDPFFPFFLFFTKIKILAPVIEIVCNGRDNVMFLVCITSNGLSIKKESFHGKRSVFMEQIYIRRHFNKVG